MRALFGSFALLIFAGTAQAQDTSAISAEIVRYGIYTEERVGQTADSNSPTASIVNVENWRLAASTHTIPAQVGVTMGVEYIVRGPGTVAQVREVTRFPSPMRNPDTGASSSHYERTVNSSVGETRYFAYGLDSPWEVVPGAWTFEIWSGDRLLNSVSFTVSASN